MVPYNDEDGKVCLDYINTYLTDYTELRENPEQQNYGGKAFKLRNLFGYNFQQTCVDWLDKFGGLKVKKIGNN